MSAPDEQDWVIREAGPSDAAGIAALSGQLGYPAAEDEIRGRLESILTGNDGLVLVAEIDGAAAGWMHVSGARTVEQVACAEVRGLVVDEAMRGRGVGRALMAAAERWARDEGYALVRVRSNVIRDGAHRFYRRLGYDETKRQAVFAKRVGGRREEFP